MTKTQALQRFWSGFGLTAYDENTVPDKPTFPYITYTVQSDSLGNVLALSGSLWYRTTSWKAIQEKSDAIENYIRTMNPIATEDGGFVRIYRGSPFSQRMSDPNDDMIRRIFINIGVEYLNN